LTSFPAARTEQVLAHVEDRCGGRNCCPYCRADYEARHYEQGIIHQLAELVRRIEEVKND
jgi:hypothetical protein